jgi:asparagine synthase (glutamine-hydrolysing)
MSGICGIVNLSNDGKPIEIACLQAVVDAIKHRGPDGERIYLAEDGSFGLARRDLVTIDWDPAGSQPACDSTKQIWVVSDGPIYNFKELAEHVHQKASIPPPQTQGKLIAELFRLDTEQAFGQIDGECAFVILNLRDRSIYLVRDALGARSLFYYVAENVCVFGSELKALTKGPFFRKTISRDSLCDYLSFGALLDTKTIYEGVSKVKWGRYVRINCSGDIKQKEWWCPLSVPIVTGKPEEYYVEGLMDRIEKSMEKRCLGKGRVSVFMGGIDSCTVSGMLHKRLGARMSTITCDMPIKDGIEWPEDELADERYGKLMAERFNVRHYAERIDPDMIASIVAAAANNINDDLFVTSTVTSHYGAEAAKRDGSCVGVVGEHEGFFAGASRGMGRFAENMQQKWIPRKRWPSFARWLACAASVLLKPRKFHWMIGDHRREWWMNFAKGRHLYWHKYMLFSERGKRSLLSSDFLGNKRDISSYEAVRDDIDRLIRLRPDAHAYRLLIVKQADLVAEQNMIGWERQCARRGIEMRQPFGDRELVDFALSIPLSVMLGDFSYKYLLNKIARSVLPDDILNRSKVSSGAPLISWISPALPRILRCVCSSAGSGAKSIFNMKAVEKVIRLHEEKKFDGFYHLLSLLYFFLWYRRWIEGIDITPQDLKVR